MRTTTWNLSNAMYVYGTISLVKTIRLCFVMNATLRAIRAAMVMTWWAWRKRTLKILILSAKDASIWEIHNRALLNSNVSSVLIRRVWSLRPIWDGLTWLASTISQKYGFLINRVEWWQEKSIQIEKVCPAICANFPQERILRNIWSNATLRTVGWAFIYDVQCSMVW